MYCTMQEHLFARCWLATLCTFFFLLMCISDSVYASVQMHVWPRQCIAMHCPCVYYACKVSADQTHTQADQTHTQADQTHTQADTQTGEACNYVYVCKQSCKHTRTTCKCIWAAILISKGFFKVSLPSQQQIHGSKLSRSRGCIWASTRMGKPKTGETMVGTIFRSSAGVGYARRSLDWVRNSMG